MILKISEYNVLIRLNTKEHSGSVGRPLDLGSRGCYSLVPQKVACFSRPIKE